MSAEVTQTTPTQLETTMAANSDEMYCEQNCRDCGSEKVLVVEVNAARGQRKYINTCDDCVDSLMDAPEGVYDPKVMAFHPESDYDAF
jgi:TFIIF-interacting CTD phosphatase-like protein